MQPASGRKPAVRQSVFQVLTCPLCREYMLPPITLCKAGHNICSSCRPGLQFTGGNKCPHCGKPLLETRNVALETIARGLSYPCRYRDAGCHLKFSANDIRKHHGQCPHRSYDCPLRALDRCKWTGRLCEMQTHVETTHSSKLLARSQTAEATWELSQAECYQNSHHVLFGYGEAFLLHKRFDIPQRKLYLAVHHCWEASSVFRYSLQLEKNCGKQSALFSNMVHSAREEVDQVLLSGEAIKVDFDMLMNFVKGKRTVRITATDK